MVNMISLNEKNEVKAGQPLILADYSYTLTFPLLRNPHFNITSHSTYLLTITRVQAI